MVLFMEYQVGWDNNWVSHGLTPSNYQGTSRGAPNECISTHVVHNGVFHDRSNAVLRGSLYAMVLSPLLNQPWVTPCDTPLATAQTRAAIEVGT